MPDSIIIVPLLMMGRGDDSRIISAVEALSPLGRIYIVNQNRRVEFPSERSQRTVVHHTKDLLGIWEALHLAWVNLVRHTQLGWLEPDTSIVFNLAPLLFAPSDIGAVLEPVANGMCRHAIGAREDIAATLADDPLIGKSRALMECFFTTLAGVRLKKPGRMFYSPDGFTGLHAFTAHRYIESDWRWIERQTGKQPWGGALVSQIQSFEKGYEVQALPIRTVRPRDWPSTLGTTMNAVISMLDRVRSLPIFDGTREAEYEEALRKLPECFGNQPCVNREAAAKEVRVLIEEYNRAAEQPFLNFTT